METNNNITLRKMLHRFFKIIKKTDTKIILEEVDLEEPSVEQKKLLYKKPSKKFKDFKEGEQFVVEYLNGSRLLRVQYAF